MESLGPHRTKRAKMMDIFTLRWWGEAWRDLWEDLRTTRWLRALGWFSFVVIWCPGLIAAVTMVALFGPASNPENVLEATSGSLSPCLPDGSFSLRPDLYNYFTPDAAFEITLGFGNLSFANAKLIDIVWDLVCLRAMLS
jgi:hypothetical protein